MVDHQELCSTRSQSSIISRARNACEHVRQTEEHRCGQRKTTQAAEHVPALLLPFVSQRVHHASLRMRIPTSEDLGIFRQLCRRTGRGLRSYADPPGCPPRARPGGRTSWCEPPSQSGSWAPIMKGSVLCQPNLHNSRPAPMFARRLTADYISRQDPFSSVRESQADLFAPSGCKTPCVKPERTLEYRY